MQISETVAILTLDGQAFGQIQSLNHCDKVIALASREDKPTAGESGLYFLHTNQIDTATLITDENRDVVWEAVMAPFGEVDLLTEAIENPLRFPGQYYDAETGLHYNYFRDYDPELGRYIESDPVGLSAGPNTYTYVSNNPLRLIDPYGLEEVYVCKRPLMGHPDDWWRLDRYIPKVNHTYICVGQAYCSSTTASGGMANSPGRPTTPQDNDVYHPESCDRRWSGDDCISNCVKKRLQDPGRPNYAVAGPHGTNCHEFSWDEVLYICERRCQRR